MASKNSISTYIAAINKALKQGDSTEHTHRPALKDLVEAIGVDLGLDITATNEPKQIACGAPDYAIKIKDLPLGHIEAKDVGIDLDKVLKTDQLKRYLVGLPSLILTDYLEFRWYVLGELRMTVRLDPTTGEGAEEFRALLAEFLKSKFKTLRSPEDLAKRMGGLAQLMRDAMRAAFKAEDKGGELHNQLKGFRQVLIDDLSEDDFADMYAQTICYGLFAARCNHKEGEPFTRYQAAHELPRTNPFLRKIFGHVAGPELDERVTWIVDDLAELLDRANIKAILKDFGKRTRQEDPVVHFYETFLGEYDQKMKEARGVYYTPEPVVNYIVKSVDQILKRDFKIDDGLADTTKVQVPTTLSGGRTEAHKVTILDPATGTGTFLREVIAQIRTHVENTGQTGSWSSYVSQHLLPRVFGFELLMAPYAVCHMKLGLQLADLGYDFKANERLRVYLTNSLQEAHELTGLPLFAQEIANEAKEAGEAKQDHPVMVVLGNPPYSGHSANKGKWMHNLMRGLDTITDTKTESYFEVDGARITDKGGQKWINNDYVKFIRFAQWRIEQTGFGVLAFITDHSYLDNPTFRGMRQSLMTTFDDIYILDLHGNSKKKETAPDGTADKNVFDITQGVNIGIFVKKKGTRKAKPATVRHAELWGTRDGVAWAGGKQVAMGGKYDWLYKHDVTTTKWKVIEPKSPFYHYFPINNDLREEYNSGWAVQEIFAPYGDPAPGMVTTHDQFAISLSSADAIAKVEKLLKTTSETEARNLFRLCAQNQWQYNRAKTELSDGKWRKEVTPVLYRPFDKLWTVYNKNVAVHRRERASFHMVMGKNKAICIGKAGQVIGPGTWDILTCTTAPTDFNLFRRGGNCVFPIYLYPKEEKEDLFDTGAEATDAPGGRRPNLADEFISDLKGRLGLKWVADGLGDLKKTFGPEDVFHYMYAVFHSPTYRDRYGAFLKIDFPRLPLTSQVKLFRTLCKLGAELTGLHLMESKGKLKTCYPVDGDHVMEKAVYMPPKAKEPGRVWINDTQYFEGVPEDVWNFHVGGYQVCHKWLKDRKGRELSYDDQVHYQGIVAALSRTIVIMADIDKAIDAHGGWPLT